MPGPRGPAGPPGDAGVPGTLVKDFKLNIVINYSTLIYLVLIDYFVSKLLGTPGLQGPPGKVVL